MPRSGRWPCRAVGVFLGTLLAPTPGGAQGRLWKIEVEEPTGIERREDEVARLAASFRPGEAPGARLVLLAPDGRESVLQVAPTRLHPDGTLAEADLLFPVTLVPGERPRFTLMALPAAYMPGTRPSSGGGFPNEIVARHLATSRLEIGNARFTAILNLGRDGTLPAIVEAYSRTAGEHRMLNLVETTPDVTEPLPLGEKSAGWSTALQGAGRLSEMTEVEVLESGPLRGRVRLRGGRRGTVGEEWELEWTAGSPVLLWQVRTEATAGRFGFVLSSLSASPYEPFTHWAHGSEKDWPSGWTTDKPPHRPVVVAKPGSLDAVGEAMAGLPGRHVLYYRPDENYGALGLIETDLALSWSGVGSRQVVAVLDRGGTADPARASIGLSFPRFRGNETLLEARSVARRFVNPLIAHLFDPEQLAEAPRYEAAPRTPAWTESRQESPEATPPAGGSLSQRLSLDGGWRLEGVGKGEGVRRGFFDPGLDDSSWRPAPVPGTAHADVLPEGGSSTPEAGGVSGKEWWYRRAFRVPDEWRDRRLSLEFAATDYYADVWLNGRLAGRHEGYVDPWEIEVGDRLRWGEDNVVAVRVWTPVKSYAQDRPYIVKGAYGGGGGKPGDVAAVGVTGAVSLRASGPLRIEDVLTRPSLKPDGSADLQLTLVLDRAPPGEARIELSLRPRNFDGPVRLVAETSLRAHDAPDGRTVSYRFHVPDPRLWWTWDRGRPNLYTLVALVRVDGRLSDQHAQPVGLRTVERVGRVFYLNGSRLSVRGTSRGSPGPLLSGVSREEYERDLRLVKEMDVNMVRLHGPFARPELYEAADETGILVWQGFLEGSYPQEREFAVRAARLYDPLVRMVRAHPSVALWTTSDEEDLENYRVLTKHLAPRAFEVDPERRSVQRSGGRSGDLHANGSRFTVE